MTAPGTSDSTTRDRPPARAEGPFGPAYRIVTVSILALVTMIAFESMAVSTVMRPPASSAYRRYSEAIQARAAPMPRRVSFCGERVWRVPKLTSFAMVCLMRSAETSASAAWSSASGSCGCRTEPASSPGPGGGQLALAHEV